MRLGTRTAACAATQRRFEDGGLAALGRPCGYPSGPPLRGDGKSLRQIAAGAELEATRGEAPELVMAGDQVDAEVDGSRS